MNRQRRLALDIFMVGQKVPHNLRTVTVLLHGILGPKRQKRRERAFGQGAEPARKRTQQNKNFVAFKANLSINSFQELILVDRPVSFTIFNPFLSVFFLFSSLYLFPVLYCLDPFFKICILRISHFFFKVKSITR